MEGNAHRSIRELSAEVATNPDSTAFVELVAAYRELGDLDRALRLSLRGLARHPTHVEAHYELGRVYRARGERELALDEWSIVRRLSPEHVGARRATAELYLEEGNSEAALSELEDALKVAPADFGLWELSKRIPALAPSVNGTRESAAEPRESEPRRLKEPEADSEPLGALFIDESGEVITAEGSLGADASEALAPTELNALREEAGRVTEYLGLGVWQEVTVEGERARWAIRPLNRGVLVVCTNPDLPPGRAARVVERVSVRVKRHGRGEGG